VQPFTLLIKPSGSDCNIDCKYCFYKNRSPEVGRGTQRMSDQVLEKLVTDYVTLGFPVVGFAWQGGEPTLMGLDFFQKAVTLQKKYAAPGQEISNTMQTNGILLDDKWCRFFHDNKFLIGLSIDGPRQFHDYYRLDHSGSGTFDKVLRTIWNFKKYRVEFNTLTLLNNHNVDHPDELFDFLVANGSGYMQFIPCIETDPATGQIADFSITPPRYADFLCRIFDRWYDYGPHKLNIREIDSLISYFVLGKHTICTYSPQCAGFVVVEHTGDCFCCEFFVEPKWRLGNILQTPLQKLAAAPLKRTFARTKQDLCDRCLLCRHLAVCRGGCLKDRVAFDGRHSYFCESYKRFFDYVTPRARQIAAAINTGDADRRTRSPDAVRLKIK
jgi:uncharacterized protein